MSAPRFSVGSHVMVRTRRTGWVGPFTIAALRRPTPATWIYDVGASFLMSVGLITKWVPEHCLRPYDPPAALGFDALVSSLHTEEAH